jgi:hypothetical protein
VSILHDRKASGLSRLVLTEFQNFSEFRYGNHPEIQYFDPFSFRFSESWFISFSGDSENSQILSTRLPLIEKNGSSLSGLQRMAFLRLMAVQNKLRRSRRDEANLCGWDEKQKSRKLGGLRLGKINRVD